MKRLRVLFAISALVLLAPIGLLVQRSLDSLAVEERMQQLVVAERIFDEMERGLSVLLADEEAQPVENYDTGGVDQHEPFIVSRFLLDARESASDGDASASLPDAAGGAVDERRAAAPPVGDRAATAGKETRENERMPAFRDPPARRELARQAPGTTIPLDGGAPVLGGERKDAGAKAKSDVSEYDVLRSLNKAALERSDDRVARVGRLAEGADRAAARAPAAAPEVLDLRPGAFGPARMSGRAVGSDRFMLYRTVARDGSIYQQGVVYDVAALGAWLRDRSIGGIGLGDRAVLEFYAGGAPGPAATAEGSSFRHRFASPFDDLSAALTLRPLSSGDSGLYVRALSLGLIAATLLGLALLYWSVAQTVRFAERRSNFAAAVSHELKTPLTAIRMYGEMLRDGVVPSDAKRDEYYRHITSESERLSRLINNVLEFAKLEKGNRDMRPLRAGVATPLHEVAEAMRPHASERGFELAVDAASDLPPVRYEADAFAQVLWNLIDNAIKYARGAADRRIEIGARREGATVRVSVRDHGPGVDPRHLRDIFAPYYRAENELTRTATGAGLGLALVDALVTRMGASVRGRNHPDGGFVVEISFPIAD